MKIKETRIIKIAESIVIEVEKNEFQLEEAVKLVKQYVDTNKLDGVGNVIVRFSNTPKEASHRPKVDYCTVTIENPELHLLKDYAEYIAYITTSSESCEKMVTRITKNEGVIGHFEYRNAIRIKKGIEGNTPFRVSIKPTTIIMDEA